MSLFGWGKDIAEPIKAIGNLYTTDKDRLEGEQKLQETLQKPQLAQLDTNKVLSMSANIFTSGWQPLLGWTCGFLILLYYAPQIIIATYIWYYQCVAIGHVLPFPMKSDDILNLVYLLFGIGGYSLVKGKG